MLKVLYEDNHVIVCVKPRGILSQEDSSGKPDMVNIVKDYIKEKYDKPGNVYLGLLHRLDINTLGIMVFARTSKAASRLSEDIKNHHFLKKYKATVVGTLTNKNFITLTNNIKKDEKEKKSYIANDGQYAELAYRAIKNYKIDKTDVTDLDIILKTGRFHQIRCQMSNLGHPLYGDSKYGSKVKKEGFDIPLVAYHLEFTHPVTKELMVFELGEEEK